MLVWAAVSHLRLLRYLRRWAGPVRDGDTLRLFDRTGDRLHLHARPALRQCRGLRVPMLAGLLSPVLLLPEEPLNPQSLRYSILHELTHFRRRDIWLKTLALWVRAIHWFDPLVWLMAGAIERDTELACDEASLNPTAPGGARRLWPHHSGRGPAGEKRPRRFLKEVYL